MDIDINCIYDLFKKEFNKELQISKGKDKTRSILSLLELKFAHILNILNLPQNINRDYNYVKINKLLNKNNQISSAPTIDHNKK